MKKVIGKHGLEKGAYLTSSDAQYDLIKIDLLKRLQSKEKIAEYDFSKKQLDKDEATKVVEMLKDAKYKGLARFNFDGHITELNFGMRYDIPIDDKYDTSFSMLSAKYPNQMVNLEFKISNINNAYGVALYTVSYDTMDNTYSPAQTDHIIFPYRQLEIKSPKDVT